MPKCKNCKFYEGLEKFIDYGESCKWLNASKYSKMVNAEMARAERKKLCEYKLEEVGKVFDTIYSEIESQQETINNLMSTINHLNDLLKRKNDEIATLQHKLTGGE